MSRKKWYRRVGLFGTAGAVLLQAGCALDPDLLLQAATQLFTEFAIFFTDAAVVAMR
ncbi:MAG: hypothetical protein HZB38_09295 [Planctomycetes bacterium]|nr:hypothetical protein [Planctomycetota bacterium]